MAEVVELDTQRPHVTIWIGDHAYITPTLNVERWITGEIELPEPEILRRIIQEWWDTIKEPTK